MNCERQARPTHDRDVSGAHQCTRRARWLVTVPTGEQLSVCTQHLSGLRDYWYGRALVVEEIPAP